MEVMGMIAVKKQDMPSGNGPLVLPEVMKTLERAPYKSQRLLNDLNDRSRMGKEKYGTELRAFNGRSALLDLYQEILDAIMYAQQSRMEGDLESGKFLEMLLFIASELSRHFGK
jgi:hypothetical protein